MKVVSRFRRNFCCFIVFILSVTAGLSQNKVLDSIKLQLNEKNHDTTRLSLMLEILHNSDGTEYKEYTQAMMELAKKNMNGLKPGSQLLRTYKNYLAWTYFYEGEMFVIRRSFQEALNSFAKSMSLSRETKDDFITLQSKVAFAKVLTSQENYKGAIELFYEALKSSQLQNDHKNTGEIYVDIGRIYRRQKNYTKSIEFYNKAVEELKVASFKPGLINALNKLFYSYSEINESEKAVDCLFRIEAVVKTMTENEKAVDRILVNALMSKVERAKGNNELAIDYLNKNLVLLKRAGIYVEVASTYSNIATIYQGVKQYRKAIHYAEKAQELNIQTRNSFGRHRQYEVLYTLYKLTGDYKKALKAHEQFVLMGDSIRKKEDEKHVIEAELNYQFEKKELLAKAENEKKLNELRLQAARKNAAKNVALIIISSCLVLLAGLACFLFYYFRQKVTIQQQKSDLLKQKLLLSQMNPHFIFNSLNAIQNYIFKQNVLQAGTYLSQFAEMMRMILDFSRKDYISLASELKFLENYLKLQQLRFDNKFDYHLIVDEKIDTDITLVPPMMAQPFIENAIEHGIFYKTGKGTIHIIFNKNEHELEYIIEDDGIGLDASEKMKSHSEQKHESLAMAITGERMQALYKGRTKEPAIELIDKGETDTGTTGVKVKFAVQFKEL